MRISTASVGDSDRLEQDHIKEVEVTTHEQVVALHRLAKPLGVRRRIMG
jgi:hypothetical protein